MCVRLSVHQTTCCQPQLRSWSGILPAPRRVTSRRGLEGQAGTDACTLARKQNEASLGFFQWKELACPCLMVLPVFMSLPLLPVKHFLECALQPPVQRPHGLSGYSACLHYFPLIMSFSPSEFIAPDFVTVRCLGRAPGSPAGEGPGCHLLATPHPAWAGKPCPPPPAPLLLHTMCAEPRYFIRNEMNELPGFSQGGARVSPRQPGEVSESGWGLGAPGLLSRYESKKKKGSYFWGSCT